MTCSQRWKISFRQEQINILGCAGKSVDRQGETAADGIVQLRLVQGANKRLKFCEQIHDGGALRNLVGKANCPWAPQTAI